MAERRNIGSALILTCLVVGLVTALATLVMNARGVNGGLAVSCGLLILAVQGRRSPRNSKVNWTALVPIALIAVCVVAVSASTPLFLFSSLCWLGLIAGGTLFVMKTSTLFPSFSTAASRAQAVTDPQISTQLEAVLEQSVLTQSLMSSVELTNEKYDLDEDESEEDAVSSLPFSNEQTMQRWSRLQTSTEERLEGVIVVEFAAGQKQCYVHVPFSPVFQSHPVAYCECDGDGTVEVELDLLQRYGARLSARRRGPFLEPARCDVSLTVVSKCARSRAA